jgi:hypothetical protein
MTQYSTKVKVNKRLLHLAWVVGHPDHPACMHTYIHTFHISLSTMDMKLVTDITQTSKAGRQHKAKQTL